MLKIIGAGLVVAASGIAGSIVAGNYAARPTQLRSLHSALQVLETEITFASTPLPEAWERVSKQSTYPVSLLFKKARDGLVEGEGCSASEAWQKGLKEAFEDTALTVQDLEIVMELGNCLGISYRDDQVKHLRLTRENLRQQELAAQEEAGRQVKLWRYFGVMGGLVIAILLY